MHCLYTLNVIFLGSLSARDLTLLCIVSQAPKRILWIGRSYHIALTTWLFSATLYIDSLQKSNVSFCSVPACISVGTLVESSLLLSKIGLGKDHYEMLHSCWEGCLPSLFLWELFTCTCWSVLADPLSHMLPRSCSELRAALTFVMFAQKTSWWICLSLLPHCGLSEILFSWGLCQWHGETWESNAPHPESL